MACTADPQTQADHTCPLAVLAVSIPLVPCGFHMRPYKTLGARREKVHRGSQHLPAGLIFPCVSGARTM